MHNHLPVLVSETLGLLSPQAGDVYVDATAGQGGHAQTVIDAIGPMGQAYLIDQDVAAVTALKRRFEGFKNVTVIHGRFGNLVELAREYGIGPIDLALFDLGFSSVQLDDGARGLSFKHDGPLDMRLDQTGALTAADVVNNYAEWDLADVIWRYGEERRSRRIAQAIVSARPLKTTGHLAEVIRQAVPRQGKIDQATKTFQAIRIEVNDELGQIVSGLEAAVELLKPGGKLAVISFHSLEDRIVKRFIAVNSATYRYTPDQFQPEELVPKLARLTKSPVTVGAAELKFNPRSRSAKLRVAVKQ